MTAFSPLVVGVEGLALSRDELGFLRDTQPYGVVLFKRNISERGQLRDLVAQVRDCVPGVRVGVDQEGGRVQRIDFDGRLPSAREVGDAWLAGDTDAGRAWGRAIGASVAGVGFDWVFAPCLDRAVEGAHGIIGDRAIAADVATIVAVAEDFLDGLAEVGVVGCLKHAPGHGRAMVDSHHGLPVVRGTAEELATDMAPFKALAGKVGHMMTAHIAYPEHFGELPATLNPKLLQHMREDWGFGGLIVADDMGMAALPGSYAERVTASLQAGCDVAICSFSLIKEGMAGSFYDAEAARMLWGMVDKLVPLIVE